MSMSLDSPVDPVNDLIFGPWRARVLYAGVCLGIFDVLKRGPLACSEICCELKLNGRNGYRLLRALATIGLLRELPAEQAFGERLAADYVNDDGARFFTLTEAGECLCAGHPSGLRELALLQQGPEHTAIWRHLPDMIRDGWQNGFRREYGATAFEYADAHLDYSRIFDAAMASYSAQQATAAVEALRDFDFSGVETVCDVGGGRGTLLETLLQAHPQFRGIVLERSSVIENAAASEHRICAPGNWSYQRGDMFQSVPSADLYLLKLILHDWDDEQSVRILENLRGAACEHARNRSRLLILEFVIRPPDVPHFSKLYDIHMMCWGDGRERSLPEYERLLRRAGWEFSKFRALPNVEMGIIEAQLKSV
jgi:hypothetical protein